MQSLNKFMSEFKDGFQPANRFVCQIFVQPSMVVNIIKDSLEGDGNLFGIVDRALSAGNAILSVPQVVKWLAQGNICSAAKLPDRSFGQISQTIYGYTERFPYESEYSSLGCSFLMPYAVSTTLGRDNAVPRFFNYWMNQIQRGQRGPESGYDFNFPDNYYARILVTAIDRHNRGTVSYQFDQCYPKAVNPVQVSWDAEGFLQLPVDFTFSTWQMQHVALTFATSFLTDILS